MSIFEIRTVAGNPGDQVCTLALSGEADLAAADEIVGAGALALAAAATKSLVIDLHEITFIDSTALGALIQLRSLADAAHKQLYLTRLPTRVERVLAIAGLTALFDVFSDER